MQTTGGSDGREHVFISFQASSAVCPLMPFPRRAKAPELACPSVMRPQSCCHFDNHVTFFTGTSRNLLTDHLLLNQRSTDFSVINTRTLHKLLFFAVPSSGSWFPGEILSAAVFTPSLPFRAPLPETRSSRRVTRCVTPGPLPSAPPDRTLPLLQSVRAELLKTICFHHCQQTCLGVAGHFL